MQTILNKDIVTDFGAKKIIFLGRSTPTSVELKINSDEPVVLELGAQIALDDTTKVRVTMLLSPAQFSDGTFGDDHSFSAVLSDAEHIWPVEPKELPHKG